MPTITNHVPAKRVITETLDLADCAKGDDIDISYSHNGSWKSIGRVTLVAIKPLAKGGHQIKHRSHWRNETKVHKADVPAGVVVKRVRDVVEADGPDAGEWTRETFECDGVRYARAHDATPKIEDIDPATFGKPAPERPMTVLRRSHGLADMLFGTPGLPGGFGLAHAGLDPALEDRLRKGLEDRMGPSTYHRIGLGDFAGPMADAMMAGAMLPMEISGPDAKKR